MSMKIENPDIKTWQTKKKKKKKKNAVRNTMQHRQTFNLRYFFLLFRFPEDLIQARNDVSFCWNTRPAAVKPRYKKTKNTVKHPFRFLAKLNPQFRFPAACLQYMPRLFILSANGTTKKGAPACQIFLPCRKKGKNQGKKKKKNSTVYAGSRILECQVHSRSSNPLVYMEVHTLFGDGMQL
ncbi:hypothetical protein AA313_de0209217 [Arthrobotrys entomopaga]|nr:hypothetical protein AA313_de0209217 [Arthrobotrys entomopaga]